MQAPGGGSFIRAGLHNRTVSQQGSDRSPTVEAVDARERGAGFSLSAAGSGEPEDPIRVAGEEQGPRVVVQAEVIELLERA